MNSVAAVRDVSEECERADRATHGKEHGVEHSKKRNNASIIRDLVWALPQTG